MSRPLIRLPQSFLILVLMLSFGGAVISGGVAASPASGGAGWSATLGSFHILNRDWTGVELWSGFAHIVRANR